MKFWDFSGPGAGKPCVFPFKYYEVTAYGCIVYYEGEQVKQINLINNHFKYKYSALVLYQGR